MRRYALWCLILLFACTGLVTSAFSQQPPQKLIPADLAARDEFGSSIAVSQDAVVVGSPFDDDQGQDSGSAYVFRRNSTSWVQEAKLLGTGVDAGDDFARSVAIDGDTIVVGAPLEDGGAVRSGVAHVFSRSGTNWAEVAILLAPSGATDGSFGFSTAVSGDVTIIGSPGDSSAHLFRRNGTNWLHEAELTGNSIFGDAVTVEGEYAAVTQHLPTSGLLGSVNGYRYVAPDWVFESTALGCQAQGCADLFGGSFGASLDIDVVSGTKYFLAAPGRCDGYGAQYFTEIFRYQQDSLSCADSVIDEFGGLIPLNESVSVSISSGRAVLGFVPAPPLIEGGVKGSIRVSDTNWQEEFVLYSCTNDGYGSAVSLENDTLAVGAPFDQAVGVGSGAAYIHNLAQLCFDFDCDGSGVPDSCDCNANGVLDGVDIVNGSSADCNVNAIPDECDIQSGLSVDSNGNTIPDECEISTSYCTAKTNSDGCPPIVAFSGMPSLSAPSSFDVTAFALVPEKNGVFFYGLGGPAATAFEGGTLCVAPPLRRTPIQDSGGDDLFPCDGTFTFDFNAWIQGGNEPLVQLGSQINGQYWYRDPADPFGVGLTDAVEFFVGP